MSRFTDEELKELEDNTPGLLPRQKYWIESQWNISLDKLEVLILRDDEGQQKYFAVTFDADEKPETVVKAIRRGLKSLQNAV